jgi:6-phosphogluconolactonase
LAAQCSPFLRERLHLCWVDERGVPVGHGDRNDGAMLAAWDAGGPRPAYVHPMPAEQEDLEAAADAYAATLTDIGAGEGFDAVLLGIGEDGHIASLFPDHPFLDDLGVCAAIADSPKPPPRRLTVSLPVLAGSGSLVVLVLGAGKAEAMGTALAGPNRTVPVSLLPTDATQIFVDDGCLGALGPV